MSCERYLDLISARLDAPLSPGDEAELTAHLNTCPQCRAAARDLEGVHAALTGCPVTPPAELAEGVMNTIRGQRSARKRTRRQLGALAACLVLCAGLFTLTRPEPSGDPAGIPDMARHVQPLPLTEELSFSNEQRLRLSAASTSLEPSALLLGDAEAFSRFVTRFPSDDLSALAQTYNEEYFRTRRLLAVVVQEPSGSISHTVSRLTGDSVTILRHAPEAGSCDMALWLILAQVEGAGPETPLTVELLTD